VKPAEPEEDSHFCKTTV